MKAIKTLFTLFVLVAFSQLAWSQTAEICNNSLDDDGDGFTDAYDSDCGCTNSSVKYDYIGNCPVTCPLVHPVVGGSSDITVQQDWQQAALDPFFAVQHIVGDIDGDGMPEVIMNRGDNHNTYRSIWALNGEDGSMQSQQNNFPGVPRTYYQGMALGDVDHDGLGDLFLVTSSKEVYRYEYLANGAWSLMWTSTSNTIPYTVDNTAPALALADFNGDGFVELYVGNEIMNADNGRLYVDGGTGAARGKNAYWDNYYQTVAADILPDGACGDCAGLELIAGNTIYSVHIDHTTPSNSTLNVERVVIGDYEDGWTSVADIDQDGDLDVIVSGRDPANMYAVYAWDGQTENIIGSLQNDQTNRPASRPVIDDIDNDGTLDILVGNYNNLIAINNDFTQKWIYTHAAHDYPSTPTVFDLNGDGSKEVIYHPGGTTMKILNANNAEVIKDFNQHADYSSIGYLGHVIVTPVVADIDNDGSVEILDIARHVCNYGRVFAFESAGLPWVAGRGVWNQHAFYNVNVNDDLTIPRQQTDHSSADGINKFLVQSAPLDTNYNVVIAAPDFTSSINSITRTGCEATVNYTITNSGDVDANNTIHVAYYDGNPFTGTPNIVGVFEKDINIAAGASATFNDLISSASTTTIYVVVNDNGKGTLPLTQPNSTIGECDFSNNFGSGTLSAPGNEICGNGTDDDCDGLTDTYDPDCGCGTGNPTVSYVGNCPVSCPLVPPVIGTSSTIATQQDWQQTALNPFFAVQHLVGDIDGDGMPEVIMNRGDANASHRNIWALNGEDGSIQSNQNNFPSIPITYYQGMALGDIDNDGNGDLFVTSTARIVYRYEYQTNGNWSLVWTSSSVASSYTIDNTAPALALADFNGDGNVELYVGNEIIDANTGTLLVDGGTSASRGYNPYWNNYYQSVAADILPSGYCNDCSGMELIAGNTIYSVNISLTGTTLTPVRIAPGGLSDGWTTVADVDLDGDMDVLVSGRNSAGSYLVYAWDGQTESLIGSLINDQSNRPASRPVVDDIDNDGVIDILVGNYNNLIAINNDFSQKWLYTHGAGDYPSPPTVFDLNGDGTKEIIYHPPGTTMKILNGPDAAVLKDFNQHADYSGIGYLGHQIVTPVVADIDNDGAVEILDVARHVCNYGRVFAFESANLPWASGRGVWNQHAYHNVNVNDDLSIPQQQTLHHKEAALNKFMVQSAPLDTNYNVVIAAADFVPSITGIVRSGCDVDVTYDLSNIGEVDVNRSVFITFYDGNPFTGTPRALSVVEKSLNLTAGNTVSFTDQVPSVSTQSIFVVINDNGKASLPLSQPNSAVAECNYLNNISSAAVAAPGNEVCGNGIDDDCDGLTDKYDTDCGCNGAINPSLSYVGNCPVSCPLIPPVATSMSDISVQQMWANTSVSPFFGVQMLTGDVDGDGTNEIISMRGDANGSDRSVYVLNGEDGTLQSGQANFPSLPANYYQGMALGDVDNDGRGDLFMASTGRVVYRYEHQTGGAWALIWTSAAVTPSYTIDNTAPAFGLADFNQDGTPELYVGNEIINAVDGSLYADGGTSSARGYNAYWNNYYQTVAIDILPSSFCLTCDGLELVAGNTIYAVDIDAGTPSNSTLTAVSTVTGDYEDGWTSVADIDGDGDLDVVVSGRDPSNLQNTYAWDGQTGDVMGSLTAVTTSRPNSRPVISDIDNDGKLDILVGNYSSLRAMTHDFNEKWRVNHTAWNYPSAPTVYDLNGDGTKEVLYHAFISPLMILNGENGATIFELTMTEYAGTVTTGGHSMSSPVVADIDADGEVEILDVGRYSSCYARIFAFESAGLPWTNGRNIWNQHGYMNVNVNDDLSIPRQQSVTQFTPALNQFMVQSSLLDTNFNPVIAAADLAVTMDNSVRSSCGALVDYTITNNGEADAIGEWQITFYDGDPFTGNPRVVAVLEKTLNLAAGGGSVSLNDLVQPISTTDVYVVVNDNGKGALPLSQPNSTKAECDYTNNSASGTIAGPTSEVCGNGLDDDCDGLVDNYDNDCGCTTTPSGPLTYVGNCPVTCPLNPPSNNSGSSNITVQQEWGNTSLSTFMAVQTLIGDVEGDGNPEVITFMGNPSTAIHVLNGEDGTQQSATNNFPGIPSFYYQGMALGDVDNDGLADLFFASSSRYLYRYEYMAGGSWSLMWSSQYMTTTYQIDNSAPALGLVDFNHDGNPELYVGNEIIDANTGTLYIDGGTSISRGYNVNWNNYYQTVAADVLDASHCADCLGMELVAGNTVYSVHIDVATPANSRLQAVTTTSGDWEDGWTSVGDFDGDGDVDVVVSGRNPANQQATYAWDGQTGEILGSLTATTTSKMNSRPTLTDVDNDGQMEILVGGYGKLYAIDNDFSEMWNVSHSAWTYPSTPTVYDLDGDGNKEVIYHPFIGHMMILNGADGSNITTLTNAHYSNVGAGGHAVSTPAIGDIDNDGSVEIVDVARYNSCYARIFAFESASTPWIDGRSVWNQHAYMNVNVNDDLSIPQQQSTHHVEDALNQFMVQSPILDVNFNPVLEASAPDLTVNVLSADSSQCGTIIEYEVRNLGTDAASGDWAITYYSENPGVVTNPATIGTVSRQINLDPDSVAVFVDTVGTPNASTIYIALNDDGAGNSVPNSSQGECSYDNNTDSEVVVPRFEICGNGIDDDCDGDVDGMDSDCRLGATLAIDDLNYSLDGQGVSGNVLTNDISFTNDSLVTTSIPLEGPFNGIVTLNIDGTYDYVPNAGFRGTDYFTYIVCSFNSGTECDTADAIIEMISSPLGPVNNAPIAADDNAFGNLNQTISGNLLANDFDADTTNDGLIVNTTPVTGPTIGSVVIGTNGDYTYTPPTDYSGDASFAYQVCDAQGACDTAVVSLLVLPASPNNQPPSAGDDTYAGNDTLTGSILDNDSDPNGSPLVLNTTPSFGPANGTLTLNSNGTFTYVPASNFIGTDRFVYEVCDTNNPSGCASATVYLVVQDEKTFCFSVKAFLEGAFQDNGDSMTTWLNYFCDVLPDAQPYNVNPWNYAGQDSVTSMPAGVTDWVLLSVRDGATLANTLFTQAGLIYSDGSVTTTSGDSLFCFQMDDNYTNLNVVIEHRNHIAAMTPSGVNPNVSNPVDVDFRFMQSFQVGSGMFASAAQKEIGTRDSDGVQIYAMFSGDAHKELGGKNDINSNDFGPQFAQVGMFGEYGVGDLNLDCDFNSNDLPFVINNNAITSAVE